jgi:hypothetical protein
MRQATDGNLKERRHYTLQRVLSISRASKQVFIDTIAGSKEGIQKPGQAFKNSWNTISIFDMDVHLLLAFAEFTSTRKIYTEKGHNTVDNLERTSLK